MAVQKRHEGQYGMTPSFLLVGLVLVIIAAGGIYSVQQRNNGKEAAPETSKNPAQPVGEKDKKKSVQSENSKESNKKTDKPRVDVTDNGGLPETGPSDTLVPIVASGILAGTTIAYLRSYRYAKEYSKR